MTTAYAHFNWPKSVVHFLMKKKLYKVWLLIQIVSYGYGTE